MLSNIFSTRARLVSDPTRRDVQKTVEEWEKKASDKRYAREAKKHNFPDRSFQTPVRRSPSPDPKEGKPLHSHDSSQRSKLVEMLKNYSRSSGISFPRFMQGDKPKAVLALKSSPSTRKLDILALATSPSTDDLVAMNDAVIKQLKADLPTFAIPMDTIDASPIMPVDMVQMPIMRDQVLEPNAFKFNRYAIPKAHWPNTSPSTPSPPGTP